MCVTAVCNLHKDDVANVRFNVAKTLGNMTELVSKKHVVNNVRPALEALSSAGFEIEKSRLKCAKHRW